MLILFRKSKLAKFMAVYLSLNLLFTGFGNSLFALTGGPSQPEVQSFEPITTTQMVDPFSGDFTYNIPLMDVGGYPINLSYHSGVSMDQEASWVGLGWNINPGVINRNMRGLPDDFKRDEVKKTFNIKNDVTYGLDLGFNAEIFGFNPTSFVNFGLNFKLGLSYNNYRGVGITSGVSPALTLGKKGNSQLTASLGVSSGTNGFGIQPSVSYTHKGKETEGKQTSIGASVGIGYNSRAGLSDLTLGVSVSQSSTETRTNDKGEAYERKEDFSLFSGSGNLYTFSSPTIVPSISMPTTNFSASVSFTYGTEIFGIHGNLTLGGYYSKQWLPSNTQEMKGFGYMYSEYALGVNNGLHDYNREKDGVYNENIPNLPVTNYTYDIYSVSGQGIGGVYRPYRNDVGILHDPVNQNTSANYTLGAAEIGGGNGVHLAINVDINTSETKVRKWTADNDVDNILGFQPWDDETQQTALYEPFTFAKVGELVPTENFDTDPNADENLYEDIQTNQPVRIKLSDNMGRAEAVYQTNDNVDHPIEIGRNTARKKKNEAIQVLTNEEAGVLGHFDKILSYTEGQFIMDYNEDQNVFKMHPSEEIDRNANHYKPHHIGEITATTQEGKRYVYGTPAYNLDKKEVSFSVDHTALQPGSDYSGDVVYAATDNSINNSKGIDNFYSKTETPAYAHSYLLNAILSVDYADVDGVPGPSDNDLGSYTLFNYTKVPGNYKWRTPVEGNTASHNPGIYSKTTDDKGNYIYGEKEIWYLHSIETKTHIALFKFSGSNRLDSRPVDGENGGVDAVGNNPSQTLEFIELYSKQEILDGQNAGFTITELANLTPIKTVEFETSYSLCGSTPNSQDAKLTLDGVKFKYRNSDQASLNKYNFTYGEFFNTEDLETSTIQNPDYSKTDYDRWGNYSGQPTNATAFTDYSGARSQEFPYTDQAKIDNGNAYENTKYLADRQATSWNLTSIDLPSGSKINVEYESDDYAYVQDKKAMQMFNVIGVENAAPTGQVAYTSSDNPLYTSSVPYSNNLWLYFDFPEGQTEGMTADQIKEQLFRDENGALIDNLYFKFYLNVGPGIQASGSGGQNWEYVTGYCDVTEGNFGVVIPSSGDPYGYVGVEPATIADPQSSLPVNPISQAGWNYAQLYMPNLAYGTPEVTDHGVIQVIDALATQFTSIAQTFVGTNASLMATQSSQDFQENMSWIRLYNPNSKKKGGGVRVKKILHKDVFAGQKVAYGQEYDYTKTEGGRTISSGVAAYEPMLGGDENPFKQPIPWNNDLFLVSNPEYFQEEPFGESFFPGASVGYSQVNVRTLKADYPTPSSSATLSHAPGRTEHVFYTAQEFPTISKRTTVEHKRYKPDFLPKMFGGYSTDYLVASQGFVVELNNMHGQPKSQKSYNSNSEVEISGVEYNYLMEDGKLKNKVDAITPSKEIKEFEVGMDYDFIVDMRQHSSESDMFTATGNLDFFVAGIFPIIVPSSFPKFVNEETRFRSAVTTKVINRVGIIESVTAIDNTSRITTENVLWDGETGQVLLTKTYNEFEDEYYNFTYPAHWEYDGMGLAYQNLSYKKIMDIANDGSVVDANLTDGDQVMIMNNNTRAWVLETSGTKYLIDADGENLGQMTDALIKVIRSGRKNLATTPIGNVVSKKNPIATGNLLFNGNTEIISASAVEYTQDARVFCDCGIPNEVQYNAFNIGKRGIWKQLKSWAYLTDRTQNEALNVVGATNDYKTNIKEEGIYKDFAEFSWTTSGTYPWTSVNEVTKFATQGMEVENQDALGIYSSATFGYNFSKPTSVAKNAMYQEIGFDSFEDYQWRDCEEDHFSFKNDVTEEGSTSSITNYESHTGTRSIKVKPGTQATITKKIQDCGNNN